MSPAQRCRRNGWTVGTRLKGTFCSKETGYASTWEVLITAIGEVGVLVKSMELNGLTASQTESLWSPGYRKWRRVG